VSLDIESETISGVTFFTYRNPTTYKLFHYGIKFTIMYKNDSFHLDIFLGGGSSSVFSHTFHSVQYISTLTKVLRNPSICPGNNALFDRCKISDFKRVALAHPEDHFVFETVRSKDCSIFAFETTGFKQCDDCIQKAKNVKFKLQKYAKEEDALLDKEEGEFEVHPNSPLSGRTGHSPVTMARVCKRLSSDFREAKKLANLNKWVELRVLFTKENDIEFHQRLFEMAEATSELGDMLSPERDPKGLKNGFWEDQKRLRAQFEKVGHLKGFEVNPVTRNLALLAVLRSGGSLDDLKQYFILPSADTVNKMKRKVKLEQDFSNKADQQLLKRWKQHCRREKALGKSLPLNFFFIKWDELEQHSFNLAFHNQSYDLFFTYSVADLEDLNTKLFEQIETDTLPDVKHRLKKVFQVTVEGLATRFFHMYVFFFSEKGFVSSQITTVLWRTQTRLYAMGLNVGICFKDSFSANQRVDRIFGEIFNIPDITLQPYFISPWGGSMGNKSCHAAAHIILKHWGVNFVQVIPTMAKTHGNF